MEKRLKNYLKATENFINSSPDEASKNKYLTDLLIQIQFFQHERLIHLIVTILFALGTVITALFGMLVTNPVILALFIALLVLLIPYIRHYYILENGTQKLYEYYDILSK